MLIVPMKQIENSNLTDWISIRRIKGQIKIKGINNLCGELEKRNRIFNTIAQNEEPAAKKQVEPDN